MKGVVRFGKKEKLRPSYVGPYKFLRRIDKVIYELELPSELASVHPFFHVSMMMKYVGYTKTIVRLKYFGFKEDISYEEVPVESLNRKVKKLRHKKVAY